MTIIKEFIYKIKDIIYPNNTKGKIVDIVNYIEQNNLFLYNLSPYKQKNREEVKFNSRRNSINIPGNFGLLKDNRELFEKAQKNYNENALIVIMCHELGHSVQYSFLKKKEENFNNGWNVRDYGNICLSKTNKYDQITESAQNFFKVENNNSNGIERFMQRNFMESYADCYSGLITYLITEDKNIFEQIKDYRKSSEKEIKENKVASIKYDQIRNGTFATTEYSNIYGIEKIKDNFINKISKKGILELAKNDFEAIHHMIQVEVLDGLYKSMKDEAKNNDLFLFELKDFCKKRHGLTINDFFEEFGKHIINVRNVYYKYNSINILDNGELFYDYDKASLNISKEKIIKEYKESLSPKDLKKFEDAKITNLGLNQFQDSYGTSNYDMPIKLNDKKIISKNILNLRDKFTEQNNKNNNEFKLK